MLSLLLWMGVVFETPIVLFFLSRIGIVTPRQLGRWRRYAVVAAFILGAIITPTFDPVNQTLVALPIIALYEVGIWLAKLGARQRRRSQSPRTRTHPQPRLTARRIFAPLRPCVKSSPTRGSPTSLRTSGFHCVTLQRRVSRRAQLSNRRFRLLGVIFRFGGGVIILACVILALPELPHRIPHRLPHLRKLAHPEKQHHNHQYQYQFHGTKSERHTLNPYLCLCSTIVQRTQIIPPRAKFVNTITAFPLRLCVFALNFVLNLLKSAPPAVV